MNDSDLPRLDEIKTNVLNWFYKNRENYAFRNNRTPYKVWISETILQQTRMNAALEKMENFFSHFPDIHSLANATENEVLGAFKGLGYYNRARNLHKGAKYILNHYENLPSDYEQLLEIPSIGPYTAAAIASIAYGKCIPVIDGNIKRIFARIFRLESEINEKAFLTQLKTILMNMYTQETKNPGDLNEALMEFGQKICKVKKPECLACVIQGNCLAYLGADVLKFPVISKPKKKINVQWKLYFFINNNRVLLNKFNDFYLLKNHTGFPSIIELNQKTIFSTHGILYEKFLKKNDFHDFEIGARHTITDHNIRFMFCTLKMDDIEIIEDDLFWCPFENVENHLISSGLNKTWKSFLSNIIARGGT